MVLSENVDCLCGECLQTHKYLLCKCPRYEEHWHILQKVSKDISLPEILGTKGGILALANFLKESRAFTNSGKKLTPPITPTYEAGPEPPESDEEG